MPTNLAGSLASIDGYFAEGVAPAKYARRLLLEHIAGQTYRSPVYQWAHSVCPVNRQPSHTLHLGGAASSPKRTQASQHTMEEVTRRPASSPALLLFGHFLLHAYNIGRPGTLDVGEHRDDLLIAQEAAKCRHVALITRWRGSFRNQAIFH